MTQYPIRDIIDIRNQLATNPAGGPNWQIPQSERRGIAVHYNGGTVNLARSDLEILKSDAYGHAFTRDWDSVVGPPYIRGDGLMYVISFGRNGEKYLCRAPENVTWHIGQLNPYYYAFHVPIGDGQHATAAQIQSLGEACDDVRAWHGWGRDVVRGHKEFMPTSCPGTLMEDFVIPYRTGKDVIKMADGMYFEETGYRIDWGFWAFWRDNGGLRLFGYPLSKELDEMVYDDEHPNGILRTVQYFERAVFEYWPEHPAPFQVLLRRLGAQALSAATKP